MKNSFLTAFVSLVALGVFTDRAEAVQSAVLAEMYGRGVHAYYAGDHVSAMRYLSLAIDNGIEDPRAFYFRGMVAKSSGRAYEAEADWQRGAELEATGRANPTIGRALSRFQGADRLKLEEIRQNARLQALALSAARSQQRLGEIRAAEPNVLRSAGPAPVAPPAAGVPPAAVQPPPAAPPAGGAAENPFANDMAGGDAKVTADDALEDAMTDPFADDAAAGGAAPAAGADSNPFGGGGSGADPFGGGGDAGADPFGGGGGGADPFGGGDAGGADPFGGGDGGDPFGN